MYICITPNRLNGPHDISRYFDPVATGFHLKEYTVTELSDLFKSVGFSKVQVLLGRRGACVPAPVGPVKACEAALSMMPLAARKVVGRTVGRAFLGIRILGTK